MGTGIQHGKFLFLKAMSRKQELDPSFPNNLGNRQNGIPRHLRSRYRPKPYLPKSLLVASLKGVGVNSWPKNNKIWLTLSVIKLGFPCSSSRTNRRPTPI